MNLALATTQLDTENGTHSIVGTWKGCVSVLVPIYNEALNLDELLRAIRHSPAPKQIVIVDDGSTDGTRERLRGMTLSNDLTLVFHEKNFGKGAAIRTGLCYARGEYVLIQDSDLEYDPKDYAALLRPLEEGLANVVYGVRPDRPRQRWRFFLGAKVLTLLTNLLYGTQIHDEATCYKVFRRWLLNAIPLECTGFEFCPEVTAKLCRLKEQIWEVPIAYTPRTRKQGKKLRFRDGWMAIWTLLRLRVASRRSLGHPVMSQHDPPFPISFVRMPLEVPAK